MRLLVLSNVSGSVDRVVGLIKRSHNVVAKEANVSASAMAQNIADALGEGAYDEVILVARDPIGANMLLNKKDGVKAAVCGSVDDVRLAKDNGANVIVIRNVNSDELQGVVAEAVGSSGMVRGLREGMSIKMPTFLPKKEERAEAQDERRQKEKQQARQAKKTERTEDPEEMEEQPTRTSDGKGVVNRIKDYLGIV